MKEYGSLRERWREYQPSKTMWLWSCAACVLGTVVVGFTWGGWVTHGTAAKLVADARQNTRDHLAAALCAARFDAAPNAAAELAKLKQTDSWRQADFIAKGGWLTLPGSNQPLSDAAQLCAEKVLTSKPPPVAPVTKASATSSTPPSTSTSG